MRYPKVGDVWKWRSTTFLAFVRVVAVEDSHVTFRMEPDENPEEEPETLEMGYHGHSGHGFLNMYEFQHSE